MKRIQKARFHRKSRLSPQKPSRNKNEDSDESLSDSEDFSIPHASLLEQLKSPDPKQREFSSSLLMNLSSEISEKQLNIIYTDFCLNSIIENLTNDSNPQVIINILSAIKSLLHAEELFNDKENLKKHNKNMENEEKPQKFEKTLKLLKIGLFDVFGKLLHNLTNGLQETSLLVEEAFKGNLRKILCKLINVIASFCEILDKSLLESIIKEIALKIAKILGFIENEEIFIEILNLFHILTEFSADSRLLIAEYPDKKNPLGLKLIEVFKKPLVEIQNTGLFLAKAYIIGIFYNILEEIPDFFVNISQEIFGFLEFSIKSPILQEFSNFKDALKEKQDIDGLKLENSLKLWLKAMKAFELTLQFLNNLMENDEEYEDIDSDVEDEEVEMIDETKKTSKKNSFSIKEEFLNKFINFNNIEILSQKVLTKTELMLFEIYETNCLEELNSSVAEVNYLVISMLSKAFIKRINDNKTNSDFLRFLWGKILDFSADFKEIEHFDELLEIFLLLLKTLIDLIEKNKDFFEKSGVVTSFLNKSEVFLLGENIKNINKSDYEEILSLFYELLSLRFPISITNISENMLDFNENTILLDLLTLPLISKDIRPMVVAQALNALFDIYADETYNDALVKKEVLGLLEKIDEKYLIKNKKDKKFIKETIMNLKEFIKYKRNLGL